MLVAWLARKKLPLWHPYETWNTFAFKRQNLCRLIANVGPTHTNHLLFCFIIMVISHDSEPLRTGEPAKISNNDGDSLELALCPNRLHAQPILLWPFTQYLFTSLHSVRRWMTEDLTFSSQSLLYKGVKKLRLKVARIS